MLIEFNFSKKFVGWHYYANKIYCRLGKADLLMLMQTKFSGRVPSLDAPITLNKPSPKPSPKRRGNF